MQIKNKIKHFLLTLALLYILIRSYFSEEEIEKVDSATSLTPEKARELVRTGYLVLLELITIGLIGLWAVLWIFSARGP